MDIPKNFDDRKFFVMQKREFKIMKSNSFSMTQALSVTSS